MKAYIATDKNCDSDISLVVFAETAGKAKAYAANREEFDYYTFTDMSVRRCTQLDKYYCGGDAMDWCDPEDRVAMVREAGFSCSYEMDYADCPCDTCPATQYCVRYESMHEEDSDGDA